jgi:hypothetical protein
VTPDPALFSSPAFVLLAWGGGLAAAAALVVRWRIVGAGFTWLACGAVALIVVGAVASPARAETIAALAALPVAAVTARNRPRLTAMALLVGSIAALAGAAGFGGWLTAASAFVALGGVTGEMLLGHWFLVDPTLPRRSLKVLAAVGVGGLVGDVLVLAAVAPTSPLTALDATTIVYLVLAAMSVLLMVLVWFALDQPAYSGVMAATGLSYLAVLTSLGAVFLGRAIGAGVVLFGGI